MFQTELKIVAEQKRYSALPPHDNTLCTCASFEGQAPVHLHVPVQAAILLRFGLEARASSYAILVASLSVQGYRESSVCPCYMRGCLCLS